MPNSNQQSNTLLIAGLTPYFLERGVLPAPNRAAEGGSGLGWFSEHLEEIRKKALTDAWWEAHTLFAQEGGRAPFSPFLRKLDELGYVKVGIIENRGEFAVRGGIVDVFPINLEHPVRIEFSGNTIAAIKPLEIATALETPKLPKIKEPSEYERLWLSDLRQGDFLVHLDHGIGIFSGMETGREGREYYALEYAPAPGGTPDRLLVPRSQAPKLSRYIGFETPTVHRLGTQVWETTKRKAREETRKFAQELLEIYQTRVQARRDPYPESEDVEVMLEQTFPYEATPGQERAIRDIHRDLGRHQPMDRLLCGDVGFGKTEVALRAAARVVASGKQTALLAPTTILAEQHLRVFKERLQELPFNVAMLSRLTPKKEGKKVIEGLERGEVDIVIGTHLLLSKDVVFKDLGLVIIDEEQRFGVRHKEKFKEMRAYVDILSLSATPIPRTLSLALAKFRDLSIIQTPPAGRLPIQTFVLPFSEKIVKEAVREEVKRGGQVFYLWNRIESIEFVRRELTRLIPKVPIAIIHGRVREKELVRTMSEFREGKFGILLATTIIENGLDLPNVNTLIVANASRLGLSQSYQLRGRVGRGEVPARAYFLYPPRSLTQKGKERLRALREAQELGSGFKIALKDLEIRGAGNVLGKEQSGTMNKVGLNLYAQLLSEAVEELQIVSK